jgi:acyl carrier protein
MDRKGEIREFVHELLMSKGDARPFTDEDSLLLSGRLQSIDVVQLILLLEEKFGIDFGEIRFDWEKFDSIDTIYALTQTAAK